MDGPKVDNLVKFFVVLALAERPRHGYELIREIQEKMGKTASPGQMYPFLQKLKREGVVSVEKEGGRERKVYRMTPKGKGFARALFERFGGLIELAVRPQLRSCAHCGCMVYKGGYKKGSGEMYCCRSCAGA